MAKNGWVSIAIGIVLMVFVWTPWPASHAQAQGGPATDVPSSATPAAVYLPFVLQDKLLRSNAIIPIPSELTHPVFLVHKDLVLLGFGDQAHVWDLSDLTRPRELHRSEVLPGKVTYLFDLDDLVLLQVRDSERRERAFVASEDELGQLSVHAEIPNSWGFSSRRIQDVGYRQVLDLHDGRWLDLRNPDQPVINDVPWREDLPRFRDFWYHDRTVFLHRVLKENVGLRSVVVTEANIEAWEVGEDSRARKLWDLDVDPPYYYEWLGMPGDRLLFRMGGGIQSVSTKEPHSQFILGQLRSRLPDSVEVLPGHIVMMDSHLEESAQGREVVLDLKSYRQTGALNYQWHRTMSISSHNFSDRIYGAHVHTINGRPLMVFVSEWQSSAYGYSFLDISALFDPRPDARNLSSPE